ncbi:hypothetical protein CTRI78_v011820 [Colletotrichum trifolii]|uniref:Cupin type-2 domain-containing protein n=1 Tax=Colletotrichum trifolii TaxID=5466 RepID=A0A4R8Q8W1_COLTR|nr:hypothetical protein CTRI78_v011820 [Colletotrichum trifolii]
MTSETPSYDPLPAPRRILTTHNDAGQAVLDASLPAELEKTSIPGVDNYLAYTSPALPAPLDGDGDLRHYNSSLRDGGSSVGIAVPGGLAARVVDFLPGGPEAPLHRTESVDTGVLVEGQLELFLDSGETAVLRRGDVFVQRGTIHGWRNRSDTTTARLFVVLAAADMPTVKGVKLGEEMPIPGLEAK